MHGCREDLLGRVSTWSEGIFAGHGRPRLIADRVDGASDARQIHRVESVVACLIWCEGNVWSQAVEGGVPT